jgi:hypothetical protein
MQKQQKTRKTRKSVDPDPVVPLAPLAAPVVSDNSFVKRMKKKNTIETHEELSYVLGNLTTTMKEALLNKYHDVFEIVSDIDSPDKHMYQHVPEHYSKEQFETFLMLKRFFFIQTILKWGLGRAIREPDVPLNRGLVLEDATATFRNWSATIQPTVNRMMLEGDMLQGVYVHNAKMWFYLAENLFLTLTHELQRDILTKVSLQHIQSIIMSCFTSSDSTAITPEFNRVFVDGNPTLIDLLLQQDHQCQPPNLDTTLDIGSDDWLYFNDGGILGHADSKKNGNKRTKLKQLVKTIKKYRNKTEKTKQKIQSYLNTELSVEDGIEDNDKFEEIDQRFKTTYGLILEKDKRKEIGSKLMTAIKSELEVIFSIKSRDKTKLPLDKIVDLYDDNSYTRMQNTSDDDLNSTDNKRYDQMAKIRQEFKFLKNIPNYSFKRMLQYFVSEVNEFVQYFKVKIKAFLETHEHGRKHVHIRDIR